MEEYFLQFEGWITWLLLSAGLLLWLYQLYLIVVVHGKLALHKPLPLKESNIDWKPLSVIICTRNQEDELKSNLEAILQQDYPIFEVVVVNDRSEDDTKWVLRDLESEYPHLKVVEIAEHVLSRQGKKFGVAMGIKAAEYEHIVLTDVDCTPSTDQWLKHLGQGFREDSAEIVLGYVPLQRKKGFFSALVRFDHFMRSVDYLSAALRRRAYMGLGQNLAYAKELFFRGKGFASHIHVSAGYDALFVNQHATRENTRIRIHRDAHVWKPMEATSEAYFIQRKLHQSAFRLFSGWTKFKLNLRVLTAPLFYLVLMGSILNDLRTWPLVVGVYLFRLTVQYLIYLPIARKLRNTRMLWYLPFLDILHSFYLGMSWYGRAKKSDGALWN